MGHILLEANNRNLLLQHMAAVLNRVDKVPVSRHQEDICQLGEQGVVDQLDAYGHIHLSLDPLLAALATVLAGHCLVFIVSNVDLNSDFLQLHKEGFVSLHAFVVLSAHENHFV